MCNPRASIKPLRLRSNQRGETKTLRKPFVTPDELKRLFPNASAATIAANQDHIPHQTAQPERDSGHALSAAPCAEAADSGRFVVRVTSFRKRLINEDNLVPKYHIDSLRYAGLLPSDAPEQTAIHTTQQKVEEAHEERTEVEITPPQP